MALNLTEQQQQNLLIGYAAANAVYDLNNATKQGRSSVIQETQPLAFPTDMAGAPGYSPLPINVPAGFIVDRVIRNSQTGLDAFIAYDPATHTALVGIA